MGKEELKRILKYQMRCRNLQHSGCLEEYCGENGTTKPQGFKHELRSFLIYGIQCDRKKRLETKLSNLMMTKTRYLLLCSTHLH